MQKRKISETSKVRASLSPFCVGDGLDIGYGGDPIVPTAICMDLLEKYAAYESFPQHLHGDATDLHWFKDESLDYVYSSHVLEDFEDTAKVFDEWVRVLKVGGRLILFLPDEQTYRGFCAERGLRPNVHHIHDDFGLPTLQKIVADQPHLKIIHELFPSHIYSFELVVEKTASSPS